jgi:hypothetical protein
MGVVRVQIWFDHDFGDCVQFAHLLQLQLYRSRGQDISVHYEANKRLVWRAGEINYGAREGAQRHDRMYPTVSPLIGDRDQKDEKHSLCIDVTVRPRRCMDTITAGGLIRFNGHFAGPAPYPRAAQRRAMEQALEAYLRAEAPPAC